MLLVTVLVDRKRIVMSRRIYISCDFHERDLETVKAVESFLRLRGCLVEFAPPVGPAFYEHLERTIESCDAFLAIVGVGYSISTWLNHELHYAHILRDSRFKPRPRVFGLRIENLDLPKCSEHISVEWIDEATCNLLLEDIPVQ